MPTISTRVPDDLEAELEAYLDEERLDRSTAVRKLLSEGLEAWRREHALERFADGELTLVNRLGVKPRGFPFLRRDLQTRTRSESCP